MAERRMFAKSIIDSDAFLSMPLSAQALYFHLSMRADDEGFVGNPKTIQRQISASEDDVKILIAKRFILTFESGIVVIKHWYIHNYIQNDRKHETTYIEERETLTLDAKKSYTEKERGYKMDTKWIQNGYKLYPEISIGKDSIGKDKERECAPTRETATIKTFTKPSIDEIKAYCEERHNSVNAERFYDFYESKGWKVGNQSMRDWRACVRTWEARDKKESAKSYTTEQLNSLFDNISEDEI